MKPAGIKPNMLTTIKVEFKIRYIGAAIPTYSTHDVCVEKDSSKRDLELQINEYFGKNFNDKDLAFVYPYTLK